MTKFSPVGCVLTFSLEKVFAIEPEKSRVKLTLKKSLVDSKNPTPASFEEYQADMVTSGVISKIFEKGCLVELFGGQVAYVPVAEARCVRFDFVADHD